MRGGVGETDFDGVDVEGLVAARNADCDAKVAIFTGRASPHFNGGLPLHHQRDRFPRERARILLLVKRGVGRRRRWCSPLQQLPGSGIVVLLLLLLLFLLAVALLLLLDQASVVLPHPKRPRELRSEGQLVDVTG